MKYSLNTRDWLKGLLVSVITAVMVVVQSSISADAITFNWRQIGMAAVAAIIAYLSKNFFTNDVKAAEKTLVEAEAKSEEKNEIKP